MDGGAWWAAVHGVAKGWTQLSDFTFTFHFPALEKEMATHSSVLAWRIPGTGGPGGLPSMGLHRVGHDWSNFMAKRRIKDRSSDRLPFLGSKITAVGDCSHEIRRQLFLGRKAMTNLDCVLKSKDITLLTKIHIVKATVFPVVMYRCESWTEKKAEHWRIDAFELWCCRRLLRVPWKATRSN